MTGDPENTGKGGNSIWGVLAGEKKYFNNEINPSLSHDRPGLLSTANEGADKNTSTFFITMAGGLERLDKKHTIFGEIAEGFEVLMKLNNAYCDDDHHPIQVIRIRHTDILHDPFPDPEGLQAPDSSPDPPRLPDGRLDDEVKFDPHEGMTEEEIAEAERIHQAEANEEVLVMLGDIQDKDEAPPENVLFICKLNAITEEEDLELIFSQFGQVIGCEIIKDHVTGDSLCFGFIEFAERAQCERAYLKMDNVLIDDRRVHVDFSQSTSRHTKDNYPSSSSSKGSRYAHLMQKNGKQSRDVTHSQGPAERKRYREDSRYEDKKRVRRHSPDREHRRREESRDNRRDGSSRRSRDYSDHRHRSRDYDRRDKEQTGYRDSRREGSSRSEYPSRHHREDERQHRDRR